MGKNRKCVYRGIVTAITKELKKKKVDVKMVNYFQDSCTILLDGEYEVSKERLKTRWPQMTFMVTKKLIILKETKTIKLYQV